MKYCPNCGAQLVDEARFCSKCGAPQPNMENAPIPQPAPAVAPAPVVNQQPEQMTPRQRYQYLIENDERFRETNKILLPLKLIGLIGLLAFIPWLVSYLVPVGTLTGIDVSDYGNNLMVASHQSFPHNFSVYEVQFVLRSWAKVGNYKLTPGNALIDNIVPSIFWFFSFIFFALIAVAAIVGNPKSYVLKTYEKNPQELYKALKSSALWLFGPALAFISMFNVIMTYVNCTDLDYSDGKTYFLGIIVGNKGGLIASIVVTVIFIAVIVAASIVLRTLFFKKINKYYK